MLNQMLSARHDFGRTFMVVMWLLGTLAAAQVLAVGWAVVTRPQALAAVANPGAAAGDSVTSPQSGTGMLAAATATATTVAAGGISPASPTPGAFPPGTQLDPPVDIGVPAGVNGASDPAVPGAAAPQTVVGATAQAASAEAMLLPGPLAYPGNEAINGAAEIENPAHAISHPVAQRMLDLALEYRASGNMQAALRSLRDANTLSPNHPRVLSELAGTYTQMGLDEKAAEFWRSVYVLGADRAGAFYDLADMALKGNRIEATVAIDSVLSVGEVVTVRDPVSAEGEKVTLRIPIVSRRGSAPNAADMAMLVYFYDTVNGGDFAPTTATTGEQFVSAPYDWTEGNSEVIEETYFQPAFTEIQKKELGERKYFGYIIELYYQDELQDVVADPANLMELKPGDPGSGQLAEPETAGPGAELFPQP